MSGSRETMAELERRIFRAFYGARRGERAPSFATDIGAAWILLEAVLGRHGPVELSGSAEGRWTCRVRAEFASSGAEPCREEAEEARGADHGIRAEAPTAPLAICRAALVLLESGRSSPAPAAA